MDTFIEYMVKRKRTTSDWLKIFGAIIGAIVLSFVFGLMVTITDSMFFIMWFVLFVAVWYGVYLVVSRQNIEYEYTFTNGELDIDAIYSKRRRVHLLTVRARVFDYCAPVFDEKHKEAYLNANGLKRIYKYGSSMENDKLYFVDFLQNGDKVRLYFEPSEKMIDGIKLFNVRNVHVRDEK